MHGPCITRARIRGMRKNNGWGCSLCIDMGTVVSKRSSITPAEARGNPQSTPPPRTRSGANTASVSSVGIPLPPPPSYPLVEETTLHSARPTMDTQSQQSAATPSESSASNDDDSESERTAAAPFFGGNSRRELLEQCLRCLEGGFGVTFEREQLLDRVQEVHCRPGETLLAARQAAVGIYVVKEGELEVLSPSKDFPLCSLGVGDFCGELSSFFRIPCTATVRARPGIR